jgi:hypothetical protein
MLTYAHLRNSGTKGHASQQRLKAARAAPALACPVLPSAYVSIRQHIRQQTSACVSLKAARAVAAPALACPVLQYFSTKSLKFLVLKYFKLEAQRCTCRRCGHTSAYVSIRQHTSAYVSIRQHTLCTPGGGVGATHGREVVTTCSMHPSAYVSIRQDTSGHVSIRRRTREHLLHAYVRIRQDMSGYVRIRQDTSA